MRFHFSTLCWTLILYTSPLGLKGVAIGGKMPCSFNMREPTGNVGGPIAQPAPNEFDYLITIIKNVKIAKDSMNARPSSSRV